MKTKTIVRLVDGDFEAPIRRGMDEDEYQSLLERALDGDQAAQVRYLEKFIEVVRGIDETLYKSLIRGIIRHGPERGVEEFLEEVSDRVVLFEIEVIDMLREHVDAGFPVMEESVEV